MNQFNKSLLAILGGIEVIFYIITPILIILIWAIVMGTNDWRDYSVYVIGLLATLFRGIKIGWGELLKDG